ncbi:MAG: hypothetical protein HYR51_08070 [Candidatus Rokubacteria bacterium]|nr:hypothetical protein [Candidatus Rokubacteria bacterium]
MSKIVPVRDEVRRVQDAALVPEVAVALRRELVVGAVAHDLALQLGQPAIVDDGAEGVRPVDIARLRVNDGGVDRARTELAPGTLDLGGVDDVFPPRDGAERVAEECGTTRASLYEHRCVA